MTDRFLEPWRLPALFHPDEDVCSLALRMAERGSMTSKQFVDNYLSGKGLGLSDVAMSDRMLQRLAVIAGIDEQALRWNALIGGDRKGPLRSQAPIVFRGVSLPSGAFTTRKRIAPGVLAAEGKDAYVRLSWRFQFMPCDPETGEALIARCGACSQYLRWGLCHLWQCDRCGHDLRKDDPVYLSDNDWTATGRLAQALGLTGIGTPTPLSLPEPFAQLPLQDQLAAMVWLASFRGLVEGTRLSATPDNLYLGLSLAEDWPNTIRQVVMLIFRQTAGQYDDIVRNLVDVFKDVPGEDLKSEVIKQVIACASAYATSHVNTYEGDYWKTAQYTTFSRQARALPMNSP